MAVNYPFKVTTICNRRNLKIFLPVLVIVSMILTIPRFLEFDTITYDRNNSIVTYQCNSTEPPLEGPCRGIMLCSSKYEFYPFLWYWYPIFIETAIKFVVPYALLTIYNGGIIYKLMQIYQTQKKQRLEEQRRFKALNAVLSPVTVPAKKHSNPMTVTFMCLVMLLVFFICR